MTTIHLPGDQPAAPDLAEALRRDLALRGIRTPDPALRRTLARIQQPEPRPVAGFASSI